MDNPTPLRPDGKRPLLARLDAATQDLNAMLLVLAIGLAVLDFTCFFALEVRDAIPPHPPAGPTVLAPATAALPPAPAAEPRSGNGG